MKRITPLLVLVAVVAAVTGLGRSSVAGAEAPERYIVVLRDDVADARGVAHEHSRRHRAEVRYVYQAALKGYAATIPAGEMGAVRSDRRVAYVEPDGAVAASATTTQTGATWGLDRIDQRALPLSGAFSYTNTGAGVRAYIVDTGVRLTHGQLAGRVASGYDAVDGATADDCNGHGTHVAGTVGGSTHGVAKGVTLVAVRVLDCDGNGSWSGVIAGVDWVTANAVKPAVVNMSLGGGASTAVDDAVRRSIASGLTYAIAAGNGNSGGIAQDACKYSPARVADAITVSATNSNDTKATFANHGSCVDWFAPGVTITSAWHTGDGALNTISGTSMATPHTAGVAALYLEANPTAGPATVRTALYGLTTKGVVKQSKTTNNHLLFTNL